MENELIIPDSNIETSDTSSTSSSQVGDIRLGSSTPYKTSITTPIITVQLSTNGDAVQLGDVSIKSHENVKQYTIEYMDTNGNWKTVPGGVSIIFIMNTANFNVNEIS